MGSAAPGLALEETTLQDSCCLPPPSCKRSTPALPPRSLLDPAPGSGVLSLKKIKLEAPSATSSTTCNCASYPAEEESDDEADQRTGSLSLAIGERLSTLQHLLPQGLELEEEEVLKVAIEYVKELERQIQMFHSTTTEGWAKHEPGVSDSPLQRRGLCIVPLSTLAKAL